MIQDGSVGMAFRWLATQIQLLSGGFAGTGGSNPLNPPTGNITGTSDNSPI